MSSQSISEIPRGVQETLLRLHCLPIANASGDTHLTPIGEIQFGAASRGDAPPHVESAVSELVTTIISTAVNRKHSIGSPDSKAESENIKKAVASFVRKDVALLGEVGLQEFNRAFVSEVLKALCARVEALPSFDAIMASTDSPGTYEQALRLYSEAVTLIDALNAVSEAKLSHLPLVKELAENLDHDILGSFFALLNSLPVPGHAQLGDGSLREYENERSFILQVLQANYSIVTGEMRPCVASVQEIFQGAIDTNARRFEYEIVAGGGIERLVEPRKIIVNIPPQLQIWVDPDALALVMFNIIKNPLKIAKRFKSPSSLFVSAEPAPNSETLSVFIRDNAIGLSYDQWRDYFTKIAQDKVRQSSPLNVVEQCLLDECWREHVPPVALAMLIMNRGASSGDGTGIGLALTRQIIEGGHQGVVRLYDHPEYGAGVEIILPTDASASPDARRAAVQRRVCERLKDSLEPSA